LIDEVLSHPTTIFHLAYCIAENEFPLNNPKQPQINEKFMDRANRASNIGKGREATAVQATSKFVSAFTLGKPGLGNKVRHLKSSNFG
jgi:hypothetical protein